MTSNPLAASLTLLDEPTLDFRYGQRLVDPHAGLALFGPYDADDPAHPKGLSYAIIGTPEGISAFEGFARVVAEPIVSQEYGNPRQRTKATLLWPPFPGFEAAFAAAWPTTPSFTEQ